ncbi:alpha amylase N-terminal ig-like domain-containing protein [Acutalibacter caecimuris]|uniref:alpha amylase N-terminal ig-like domain-containing protein n=1 Tax=Acutalibacter caecimuris TaxID=3093657 RepID=UPI002AC8EA68|nr:alpha amylase N-terminal ig-like domain-containing protein [Acutalibacter sp. M00118]
MELAAIRHFADKTYCYALEKGRFLIRLETKRGDMARVRLHTQEKYLPAGLTRQVQDMELACADRYRDYYEAVVTIDMVCLRYFFEMEDATGRVLYYGDHGFYEQCIQDVGQMFDCPQTLREEERFLLPGWARNKVIYQIFPSRFATDKEVPEEVWYQAPIGHAANLQGSLRGIIDRLDYLCELGVGILYMTPVFRSRSSHKYDIDDYYAIDPSFGDKEDLKELVSKAHSRGMYVILDGVFNHTSVNFFAFRDLKEKGEQSKYRDWYYVNSFPLTAKRGEKPSYKTFSYAGGMPKLNLQNREAADFVIDVATYWIKACDIDGWRLDVADEINHAFWKRFRRAVKAVKPEALIVGEIWHYAGDFLEGDEWDSVMNYPFYYGVQGLVADGSRNASAFLGDLGFLRGNLHRELEGYLWNFIDTHDTARFRHTAGNDRGKQRLAAAIQLLLPGMPMIYYGDEVGMDGGADPDCRRGMLWDKARQDRHILAWYRKLIRLRQQEPTLTEGKLVRQHAEDRKGLLVIERRLGGRCATLVFHAQEGNVPLPALRGRLDQITGQAFSGNLGDYEVAVFVEGEAEI